MKTMLRCDTCTRQVYVDPEGAPGHIACRLVFNNDCTGQLNNAGPLLTNQEEELTHRMDGERLVSLDEPDDDDEPARPVRRRHRRAAVAEPEPEHDPSPFQAAANLITGGHADD